VTPSTFVPIARASMVISTLVRFLDRCFQPHLDQIERVVEVLERSCTATGSRRRTLEDGFEIVVIAFIQTAEVR
jgi:hypothetical protein